MFSMAFIGLVMSPVDSMGLVSLVWIGSSLVPCLLRQIACDSSIDSTLNFFNTSKPFFRHFTTSPFHQCLALLVLNVTVYLAMLLELAFISALKFAQHTGKRAVIRGHIVAYRARVWACVCGIGESRRLSEWLSRGFC